ncbi:MAG: hypothetical protein DLM63_00205 [Solirubrobacterales bacterium]|nr:MAG: hypothetical protein DLM63_00205 [Solirubrobacterales bacterium]
MPQPNRQSPPLSPPEPQSPPSRSESPTAGVSGPGSSAAEFIADPGPAFDPEQAPDAPELEFEDEIALELQEGWQEETIRSLLVTQGNVTHALLKVGADDGETWKHTQDDLRAIAPPMTRILNRYDATRAAAAAGDEIALAAAVAAYGARNYTRRRRLLAAIAAQEPVPITGVPADPDLHPEFQEIYEAPPALRPKGVR